MRVLIVEDEEFLADAIRTRLAMDAIAADVVGDGDAALEAVDINDYDVVLLDRDIPGIHGDDVCRALAADPESPAVLMLTAAGSLDDRVGGLELGADDYLAKPFEFPELIARLRALNRRSFTSLPPVLERRGVRLDPFRREVVRQRTGAHAGPQGVRRARTAAAGRRAASSAPRRFSRRPGTRTPTPSRNTVKVTISTLRRKLGDPDHHHDGAGSRLRHHRRSTRQRRATDAMADATPRRARGATG